MVTLEITFLGLCAILTSESSSCEVVPPGDHETQPFNVVFVDPGGDHRHSPMLWVPVDDLAATPDECYQDQATLTTDCGTDTGRKWVHYSLTNKELRIVQPPDQVARVTKGYRQTDAYCWAGLSVADLVSCRGVAAANARRQLASEKLERARADIEAIPEVEHHDGNPDWKDAKFREKSALAAIDREVGNIEASRALCIHDISWIPSYSKTVVDFELRSDLLSGPPQPSGVAGVLRNLRGTLQAKEGSRPVWKWEWNHPSCGAASHYEQEFATRAIVTDVHAEDTLWLVDTENPSAPAVPIFLKDSTGARRLEIWNLPHSDSELWDADKTRLVKRNGKCYVAHASSFDVLTESVSPCQLVPYVNVDANDRCPDEPVAARSSLGPTDPYCPAYEFP